jgi:hypothetical protein
MNRVLYKIGKHHRMKQDREPVPRMRMKMEKIEVD